MYPKRSLLLPLAGLIFLWAALSIAQDRLASIQGVVRDRRTGQPVAGAVVRASASSATSDESGQYSLGGLAWLSTR